MLNKKALELVKALAEATGAPSATVPFPPIVIVVAEQFTLQMAAAPAPLGAQSME